MTVKTWKHEAVEQLKGASVGTSWYLDARLLMEKATSLSQVEQIVSPDKELTADELRQLEMLLEQRLEHRPMAYILGEKEFYGRLFSVNEHTLIPRSDTETIIEAVLRYAQKRERQTITPLIDVCCGTGAIGITLAAELNIPLYLSDISEQALAVAHANAKVHVQSDVTLYCGDLLSPSKEKYAIIVSNPPYLTPQWCEQVSKEVSWEPRLALDGLSGDGLALIRTLIAQSTEKLKDEGALFLECDYRQAKDVAALLEAHRFTQVSIEQDLSGLDRVVWGVLHV